MMLHIIFQIFVTSALILISEAKGEHCIGKDDHLYYCNGFCCAGFGCCSYTSLWYAWTLMALVIAACLCGCISCSMRRYHLGHQATKYQQLSSRRHGRRRHRHKETDRLIGSRHPRFTYNTCTDPEYGHINNTQLPPPYSIGPSAAAPPPPYSSPLHPNPS